MGRLNGIELPSNPNDWEKSNKIGLYVGQIFVGFDTHYLPNECVGGEAIIKASSPWGRFVTDVLPGSDFRFIKCFRWAENLRICADYAGKTARACRVKRVNKILALDIDRLATRFFDGKCLEVYSYLILQKYPYIYLLFIFILLIFKSVLTTKIRPYAIVIATQEIIQQIGYICMAIALGEPRRRQPRRGRGRGGVCVSYGAHLVQAMGIAASLDAAGHDPAGSRSGTDGQVPGICVNAQH